jgi:hypothetical protein
MTGQYTARRLDGIGAARNWPTFNSRAWHTLHPDDQRKRAAVLEYAIRWEQYIDALDDPDMDDGEWYAWVFRDARAQAARLAAALGRMKSFKELRDIRAKPGPVHEIRATSGWPPVAVPGQPGRWRHLVDGRQVDLPHKHTERTAA